jgi:hypothetical protein
LVACFCVLGELVVDLDGSFEHMFFYSFRSVSSPRSDTAGKSWLTLTRRHSHHRYNHQSILRMRREHLRMPPEHIRLPTTIVGAFFVVVAAAAVIFERP